MKRKDLQEYDAFHQPRRLNEGCQHQLGCTCDIPFHLRPFSQKELEWVEHRRLTGEEKS